MSSIPAFYSFYRVNKHLQDISHLPNSLRSADAGPESLLLYLHE